MLNIAIDHIYVEHCHCHRIYADHHPWNDHDSDLTYESGEVVVGRDGVEDEVEGLRSCCHALRLVRQHKVVSTDLPLIIQWETVKYCILFILYTLGTPYKQHIDTLHTDTFWTHYRYLMDLKTIYATDTFWTPSEQYMNTLWTDWPIKNPYGHIYKQYTPYIIRRILYGHIYKQNTDTLWTPYGHHQTPISIDTPDILRYIQQEIVISKIDNDHLATVSLWGEVEIAVTVFPIALASLTWENLVKASPGKILSFAISSHAIFANCTPICPSPPMPTIPTLLPPPRQFQWLSGEYIVIPAVPWSHFQLKIPCWIWQRMFLPAQKMGPAFSKG